MPGPLAIDKNYSYRFVEKWRISHSWFSGPAELNGCSYSGNPFRLFTINNQLAQEKNAPLLRWGEVVQGAEMNDKRDPKGIRIRLRTDGVSDTYTLGTERGKFSEYEPRCVDLLLSSHDAFSLYIIKPDTAKGTDEWIENSVKVDIRGRTWLVQVRPPADYGAGKDNGKKSLVQRWVLPIQDTDYWLVLTMHSSLKYSVIEHPTEHKIAEALFRGIIESVNLEPIQEIIDQREMIRPERCIQYNPRWEISCPFNYESIHSTK